MRIATVCLALALAVTPAASAKELKPKFGHRVDGILYTDLATDLDRQECRETIKRMIASCRANTNFVSNTDARKYPGCLPIFREQAESCAAHFRAESVKCGWSGRVQIDDFDGFRCTVTETGVQESGERERQPGVAPADRLMQARTRTNVRSGPGTDHARVGLLDAGERVRVTGEAGEWLRIEAPGGGAAFVHGSLLVPPGSRNAAAALSPKCAGMSKGAECWIEFANRPGCHVFDPYYDPPETAIWSGACRGGLAVGQGTWGYENASGSGQATGTLERGKLQGHWVRHWVSRYADGYSEEGPYVDGKMHGRWVIRWADGDVGEGPYVDGKMHGRWVIRWADGDVGEGPYVDGNRHGRWVIRWADGDVGEGPYVDGKKHGVWTWSNRSGVYYRPKYCHGEVC